MTRLLYLALVGTTAWLLFAPAAETAPGDERRERAEQLFREADELAAHGRTEQADEFRAAAKRLLRDQYDSARDLHDHLAKLVELERNYSKRVPADNPRLADVRQNITKVKQALEQHDARPMKAVHDLRAELDQLVARERQYAERMSHDSPLLAQVREDIGRAQRELQEQLDKHHSEKGEHRPISESEEHVWRDAPHARGDRGGHPPHAPPHEPHHAHPGDSPAGHHERMHHIRAAVEHLHAAGIHDLAEELAARAEQMDREVHARHQARDVEHALHDLHEEVRSLRHEVAELRELVGRRR